MTLAARDPRAPFDLGPQPIPRERSAPGWDWLLAGAALALALIGAVLVWAATRDAQRAAGASGQSFLYRHLLNTVIAAGLMVLVSRTDARLIRLFGPLMYLLSLVGLIAVFAVGSTVNGAHAWIRVGGGFELQPSEFMKLGMIVGLAVLFTQRAAERRDRPDETPQARLHTELLSTGRRLRTELLSTMRRLRSLHADRVGDLAGSLDDSDDDGPPTIGDVLCALILIAVPLGLVMLEPDLGSAMVLAVTAFGILLAAGVQARWTIGLLLATVLVAVVVIKSGVLAEYQVQRFTAFLHPTHDLKGAGYNVTQARIAIGNGGLFGTGMFAGPQTNGGFVPEQQTDFVFSVAGEEFGLFGGLVIIALFALLCWRGLRIAADADRAGRLVCVGVVCWFAFQAFQNIGMNIGLMPVTGLPLPFVSYGGSSMFAQGMAIGLIQAVRRRSAHARGGRW